MIYRLAVIDQKINQCGLHHSGLQSWFRMVRQRKYRTPYQRLFHPTLCSKNKSGQPHFCTFYCTTYSKNYPKCKTTNMWLHWLVLWRKNGMKSPLIMWAIYVLSHHADSRLLFRMVEAILNNVFGHLQLTNKSIVFTINVIFLHSSWLCYVHF